MWSEALTNQADDIILLRKDAHRVIQSLMTILEIRFTDTELLIEKAGEEVISQGTAKREGKDPLFQPWRTQDRPLEVTTGKCGNHCLPEVPTGGEEYESLGRSKNKAA